MCNQIQTNELNEICEHKCMQHALFCSLIWQKQPQAGSSLTPSNTGRRSNNNREILTNIWNNMENVEGKKEEEWFLQWVIQRSQSTDTCRHAAVRLMACVILKDIKINIDRKLKKSNIRASCLRPEDDERNLEVRKIRFASVFQLKYTRSL